MFVRISKSSSGAGLGLYLVKQIAEREDWLATMESEPGKGTGIVLRSGTK
jgi:signal transduction histidine kinase